MLVYTTNGHTYAGVPYTAGRAVPAELTTSEDPVVRAWLVNLIDSGGAEIQPGEAPEPSEPRRVLQAAAMLSQEGGGGQVIRRRRDPRGRGEEGSDAGR